MSADLSLYTSSPANQKPDVSTIICTCNRGSSIVATVESILKSDQQNFEILVIDQSTNKDTRDAIQPFLSDPRFHYIPLSSIGKGIACNLGLNVAAADVVVYTDDDCVVSTSFLSTIERLFNTQPQVAMIFCSVLAGPFNASEGAIPQVQYKKDRKVSSFAFAPYHMAMVMGAGMAVRKSVVTRWGGFDDNIGPGTPFQSGDDLDLALRTLSKDWCVYQLSEGLVLHYGFRTLDEYRSTIARNYFGIGGIHAKFVKIFDVRIIPFIIYTLIVKCFGQPLAATLTSQRPQGFRRIVFYVLGFIKGLKTPMDKEKLVYCLSNS